ncbi:MAG: tyrosine--tRNA ligase [Patescibacteria group bacterium]
MQKQIEELVTRNVTQIITKDELIKATASGKKLKVYLGVDPSSPDIHLGHAVVLWKLRQFQDLGHHIILLIGDFTAQIGDPTGKSKERPVLTHEQVLKNATDYKKQASKIINFSGKNPASLVFNSKWLSKLTFSDIIKLAGNFTVQQMLERDMFQERLKNNQPIGLHEFLYPLMVGYDCIQLEADVEVGGNDQLFNITAGRTLRQKVSGKSKVVLTCDLLTGSDGSKMSKSAGNIIPLNASADEMFGSLMAVNDKLIEHYAKLCGDFSSDELSEIAHRLKSNENPRDIKLDVAQNIVARYYPKESSVVREKFLSRFSDGNAGEATLIELDVKNLPLMQLVAKVANVSNSEARRLIVGNAVEVEGKVQFDLNKQIDLVNPVQMRIGKHRFVKVKYQQQNL